MSVWTAILIFIICLGSFGIWAAKKADQQQKSNVK